MSILFKKLISFLSYGSRIAGLLIAAENKSSPHEERSIIFPSCHLLPFFLINDTEDSYKRLYIQLKIYARSVESKTELT
jgi:hypothetical protein